MSVLRLSVCVSVLSLGLSTVLAGTADLVFERARVGKGTYEAVGVVDVDLDGHLDIVSGEYWYPGPEFGQACKVCTIQPAGDYYDDFSDFPLDVNGDGYPDIVSGGFFAGVLRWHENPRGDRDAEWTVHEIDRPGPIETTRFWDLDGDGIPEAIPNAGGNVVAYRLLTDADGRGTGEFAKHVIKEGGCGHGLGCGDVNGDGRPDIVIPDGWLEAPADPWTEAWVVHHEFQLGTASVPVLVHDVDADGLSDLIVGEAHNYGLYWVRQEIDPDTGARTWTRHMIEPHRSQYHDLVLADMDRDGELELVTGKRHYAHSGHDPGAEDPLGTYVFEINGGKFERVTLDFGPPSVASGVGIYMWVEDVDGNGWLDVVAPGKEGLYVFFNRGPRQGGE
jgi:hypothetical protein